jgi:hypothetical protein
MMTISASGVKNLLLGEVYNPSIPSTLCGEWYIQHSLKFSSFTISSYTRFDAILEKTLFVHT